MNKLNDSRETYHVNIRKQNNHNTRVSKRRNLIEAMVTPESMLFVMSQLMINYTDNMLDKLGSDLEYIANAIEMLQHPSVQRQLKKQQFEQKIIWIYEDIECEIVKRSINKILQHLRGGFLCQEQEQ